MLNGVIGYGDGYNDKTLPFFKNYYAGGIGSVRGYRAATLGPKDLYGNALGGNSSIYGTAEILFPMPGLGSDKSVRFGLFVDAGMVYGPGFVNGVYSQSGDIDLSQLRYTGGLSLSWFSPVGPLKFSIAQPFNEKPGDSTEVFQFQMGTTF